MTPSRPRIRGLLLDWAGTTVDHGSRAPARVFVEVFQRSGVPVTEAEARGPMGMAKRAHIAAVLNLPRVARAWEDRHGKAPVDADVQRLYETFLPLGLFGPGCRRPACAVAELSGRGGNGDLPDGAAPGGG